MALTPKKAAPIPLPDWYLAAMDMLSIQQSEIFVLYGDVGGYPTAPQEGVVAFLRRRTRVWVVNQLTKGNAGFGDQPASLQAAQIAKTQVWATLAPATGLTMDPADQEEFDRVVPPLEANPFAAAGGGGIVADFGRVHAYFAAGRIPGNAVPPLALVIKDADLLFDGDSPMAEPEKTLLSYLRQWADRPLLTGSGTYDAPHRIFLIGGSTLAGLRPALLQGRIAQLKLSLPTAPAREHFVQQMIDSGEKDQQPYSFEEGLDVAGLARITGALNLLQIEDVLYRSQLRDSRITRELVQTRKDRLVEQSYGGVIEIQYPTAGFESLVGYEPLKQYLQDYVFPKLSAGDPRCPKGCVFSGPPGTGKTALAAALAAALRLPLVVVQTEKIKNKYVGETNKNVSRLCEGIMALSPAIILIDEIDKILPTGDDNTGVSQEMLGQLQMFISQIPRGTAFFIATTNYPERVPRAMLRPGRFEQVLPLLPAHLDGLRGQTLQVLLKRMGMTALPDVDWEIVGNAAPDFTGADLEKLLIEADRESFERNGNTSAPVGQQDLLTALRWVVPTARNTGEMIASALEYCSNRRYVPAALAEKVGQEKDAATDAPRRRINRAG